MRASWKIVIKGDKLRRGDTIGREDIGKVIKIKDGRGGRMVKIERGHEGIKAGALVITKKSPKYKKKDK